MAKSNHITLEDIADKLGITKVTVSKSLRDHPDISTETKHKVKKKADELGYRRNRLAQSLTLNKTNTIGVIVPKISHTFFSDTLEGINEVAYNNDYEIVLCVSEEKEERERSHVDTLLSMQVDGLLISVSEETSSPEHLQEITSQRVPLVLFDRRVDGVDASCVTVDDQGGAYKATEHALEQGLHEIVHISGYSHVNIGQNRQTGYKNALRDHGITPSDEWIIEGGFGEADGYRGGVEMIERGLTPDAIFAVTFPVALGVEDAIQLKTPSIRDDIQIYSFGQHDLNRFFANPHTSVHQPAKKIGNEAMSLLLKRMDNPEADIADIELPTHIVDVQESALPSYLEDES